MTKWNVDPIRIQDRDDPEFDFFAILNFFRHVLVPTDPDLCWLWTGCCDAGGYGTFSYKGKMTKAHRFAYELFHGPIPFGLLIMHSCDTPPCCNPIHLSPGTTYDNAMDAVNKGRMVKVFGEQHGKHKLTEDQVKLIRELRKEGETLQKIASQFDVSIANIGYIVQGKAWPHLL